MYEAVRIFMKTNIELMDGIDNPVLYEKLFESIKNVEGAHNPHRTRARKIGSHYMINLDIEVDPRLTVLEAHEIAKKIEDSIKENIENVLTDLHKTYSKEITLIKDLHIDIRDKNNFLQNIDYNKLKKTYEEELKRKDRIIEELKEQNNLILKSAFLLCMRPLESL